MGRLLDEDIIINALQNTKFRNDLFTDRGYVRAISIIKELPTIQPVVTDTIVGDTISRQQAIDALDKRFDNIPMEQTAEILMLRKDLRNLPSVQPELLDGEWVLINNLWQCNKCGCRINVKNPLCENDWNYYFCPHCGTKMNIAVQRF